MKKKDLKIISFLLTSLTLGSFEINKKTIVLDSNDVIIEDNIETTTTEMTTIETTTTTNIYQDIMFLNSNEYTIEEINDMIIKYSSYCNITYDETLKLLKNNKKNIKNYKTIEEYIMCTTFDKAEENKLISNYCTDGSIIKKELTRDEQEKTMIEICDVLNISNEEKQIVLAIFRWETGHGTSPLCVNCNNYGGIKISNEFGIYQTPEYGMYCAIKCIKNHINISKEKGYTDTYSIVSDMSYRYCYDTAGEWTNCIMGMIYDINENYTYTKKYEN